MKVLLVNTPSSLRYRGGDTVQMRMTAKHLADLGVEVVESCEPRPDGHRFDIAHVFNLRTIQETSAQIRRLSTFGIPIVLSPIYLDTTYALWGVEAVSSIFCGATTDAARKELLGKLAAHRLKVARSKSQVLTATGPNRIQPDYDEQQRQIVAATAHLLPNSLLELHALVKTLRIPPPHFTVVPYGADPAVFLDPDPKPFISQYGVRDFVLQVGRIEPPKNQAMLAYAIRDTGLPLVLIGGQLRPEYVAMCRELGPKDLLILPHLPADQLRSAYAAARVHALPSWVETCGLVTMETALADCNVVVSTAGYELEYFRDLAYYCDPADCGSIRSSVLTAYQDFEQDGTRRDRLKSLILREYQWPRAAELTLRAYERALAARHSDWSHTEIMASSRTHHGDRPFSSE